MNFQMGSDSNSETESDPNFLVRDPCRQGWSVHVRSNPVLLSVSNGTNPPRSQNASVVVICTENSSISTTRASPDQGCLEQFDTDNKRNGTD